MTLALYIANFSTFGNFNKGLDVEEKLFKYIFFKLVQVFSEKVIF